jgi:hypothetical protein
LCIVVATDGDEVWSADAGPASAFDGPADAVMTMASS